MLQRLSMTAAILGAALALAQTAAGADAQRGRGDFQSTCAGCHNSAAEVAGRAGGNSASNKARRLDAFLFGHYAPNDRARADIIAYLLSL
ncbi:MAG: hypothetical protein HUJ27_12950 [Rhodobacteraceae bacterium]|nr:hypothetical protein [Paracoccaceae bacterium]